jgi:hypothetical protein
MSDTVNWKHFYSAVVTSLQSLPENKVVLLFICPRPKKMLLQSHAHHIGSLLRPPSLINARKLRASGYITENEYQIVEDSAVCNAIRLQIKAGFSCVNDGE